MGVLGHLPNSLKSQIVRRSRFPICPSVSKLPALPKNPEHFIYSLPSIFRIPRLSYKCANASPFSVFGQPPFFVMCEGSHILKKGNPQHLRKREIPEFTKKGNPQHLRKRETPNIYEKGKSPNLRKREIPQTLKYSDCFI